MKLPRDTSNQIMQLFTPGRVESVTQNIPWTPGEDDRGIVCVVQQEITIEGEDAFTWPEYIPMGLVEGKTYTFSVTSTIIVM